MQTLCARDWHITMNIQNVDMKYHAKDCHDQIHGTKLMEFFCLFIYRKENGGPYAVLPHWETRKSQQHRSAVGLSCPGSNSKAQAWPRPQGQGGSHSTTPCHHIKPGKTCATPGKCAISRTCLFILVWCKDLTRNNYMYVLVVVIYGCIFLQDIMMI